MQVALSVPKSNSASLDKITLAMLGLNHKASTQTKSTTVPAKKKVVAEVFPSNCLSWSARQINIKAKKFEKTINQYSRQYKVDRNLVKSVITAESCFKVKALSRAGAQGLMQLIPATAERFGVKDSYNSEQNIRAGTKYLKFLLERYEGNLKKSIAGYNAGEGAVDKYKGIPPYKETQQYVKNVLKIYGLLKPKPKAKLITQKVRVKAVYQPPKMGQKPGRHGWQYNRRLAPHLYKQ